jgi:hypothetical protein
MPAIGEMRKRKNANVKNCAKTVQKVGIRAKA